MNQEHYDRVASELLHKRVKEGVWARAFSDALGDRGKAEALYIRYQVEELEEEEDRRRRIQEFNKTTLRVGMNPDSTK